MAPDVPVVVIVGAPRSGTSLLYRLLALHPQSAWISNYQRRLPRVPAASSISRIARQFPERRHNVWFGPAGDNAYRYADTRSIAEWLFPQPVEGEPVFRAAGVPEVGGRESMTPGMRRLAPRLSAMSRWSGGSVLVTKRIGHNRRIPLLDSLLPQARFVHLIRDGRAAALSCLRVDWWPDTDVWSKGITPRRWSAAGGDPLELAAHHWVAETDAVVDGLRSVAQARHIEIRYEDLVAKPFDVLAEVALFGGLPPDDQRWQTSLQRVSFPDRSSSALSHLTQEQERAMEPARARLVDLGYAQ